MSLRFSNVQTFFAQQLAKNLSKELNTTVKIDKVDIHPFSKISIEGIKLLDLFNDTVLDTKSILVNIEDISLKNDKVIISSLTLDEANIKLIKPPNQKGFSFQFILDHFANDKKKSKSGNTFIIEGDHIALKNSSLYFIDKRGKAIYYGMDFRDLAVKNINLSLRDFRNNGSNTTAKIEHLSANEKSGFDLKSLTGDLEIDSNFAQLNTLEFEINNSNITTDFFRFEFEDPEDFEDNFETKVVMKSDFNTSVLNLKDLTFFTPFFEGINRKIQFSGYFEGTVADFKTNNLFIKLDNNTYYKGDLAMKGLPYTKQTSFKALISDFKSNENELQKINIPPFQKGEMLTLPKELNGIGNINASGYLEGKFNDFKGNILAITNLGKVKTDGRYWENKTTNASIFNGNIETSNLEIGKVLRMEDFGNANANLKSNVVWNSRSGYDASINGILSSISYKGYTYKKVTIDGDFNDAFFSGKAIIKDPNANLTFDGMINYKDTVPQFNFKSNITSINLQALNLTTDSVSRIICVEVDINGEGSNPDNANGYAILNNLSYYQDGKEYEAEEIEIVASPKDDGRILNLTSSLLDATIDGRFKISELGKCIDYIASQTAPALYEDKDSIVLENQNFSFNALVKDYKPINMLFTPEVNFSKNTFIVGKFNAETSHFNILFKSDTVVALERTFIGIDGYLKKPKEEVKADINFEKIFFNENSAIDNVTVKTILKDNLLTPSITWRSDDNENYGYLQGNGYWYSLDYFDFLILPSYIHFNNMTWKTSEDATFIMDGDELIFNGWEARNQNNEAISAVGTISPDPEDQLNLYLDNFKLENLNSIIGDNNVQYYGEINGSSCISDLYNTIAITSDFNVKDLKVNTELIGNLTFNTDWENDKNRMMGKGELIREGKNAFDFLGFYYPFKKENALDFVCEMDETPIAFVSSYLVDNGISELYGYVSGDIKISGMPQQPLLNGKTKFDNIGFKVDYLNTYYDFTGEVFVEENDIYTNNVIEIRDMTDNLAMFNGAIYHENFSNFDFNIFIDIPQKIYARGYDKRMRPFNGSKQIDNKFYCLNTNSNLNSDFYGNVYATGDINIEGYEDEIAITVNAKTRKGTVFTLPLYGSSEVALEDYIIFTDSTTSVEEEETINLSGLELDLNIEATPDAELQIIFDEVYGDIMRGKGNGNLNISVDKNEEIKMTGKYVIEEGDYLFTLGVLNFENIINKKFEIANGSMVNWYGDPYNAEIDINAIYKLKASLFDIMTSYSDEEKARYKNRSDVECYMNLTQSLMRPDIKFEIQLPRADENAKTALSNLVQTEQELNKQVFSLLILNRFLPQNNFANDETRSGSGAISSTASELLSNQVSNWLSQLSKDVDIGLNYRPGDNISNDELAVALSTELLNDRLVISSNFGVSAGNEVNQNPNALIGDVSVEYKLNEDGTFRVRAFSRTNEYDVTNANQSATTQGAGLYYKKEFNGWKDFFKRKKKKNR